jgi:hypothetical protein
MESIKPPWQAIKEWIPDEEPDLDWFNYPRKPSPMNLTQTGSTNLCFEALAKK